MRSITNQSRAHIRACGWTALALAGLAIAGCGRSGHKSTTAALADQQPGAVATVSAQSASAAITPGRRAKSGAGQGTSSGADSTGKRAAASAVAHSAGAAPSPSRRAGTRHNTGKLASASVASRRASSGAGAGLHESRAAHSTTPEIPAGAVLKTMSGSGDSALGLLKEDATVVLQWQTTSSAIEIFTAQGFRLVSSPSSSGRVRLTPGEYPGLRVSAKGPWTIQLRAVA